MAKLVYVTNEFHIDHTTAPGSYGGTIIPPIGYQALTAAAGVTTISSPTGAHFSDYLEFDGYRSIDVVEDEHGRVTGWARFRVTLVTQLPVGTEIDVQFVVPCIHGDAVWLDQGPLPMA